MMNKQSFLVVSLLLLLSLVVFVHSTANINDLNSFSLDNIIELVENPHIFAQQQDEAAVKNVTTTFAREVCSTNPRIRASSKFLRVINGCHIDTFSNKILLNLSKTIIEWFTTSTILNCIFVVLLVLPWFLAVYDLEQRTSENMSRYAYFTMHGCDLLFRLAWTASVGTWLLAVFRQHSPCACSMEIYRQIGSANEQLIVTTDPVELGYAFGMPSTFVLVCTVLSLHAFERFSFMLGAIMLTFLPVASVFSGYASMGQVLSAFAIGIVVHIYQTRTPQWIRLLDFVFNIVAGVLVIPLVKHFYMTTDFSFAIAYFEGVIMQVFAIMVMILIFSFGFLKKILLKTLYYTVPLDIQFFNMKLLPDSSQLNEGDQQGYEHSDYSETTRLRNASSYGTDGYVFSILYSKRFLFYGLGLCAIILVMALRVAGHHINEAISFGKDKSN